MNTSVDGTTGKQSVAINGPIMGPTAVKTRIGVLPSENIKEKQVRKKNNYTNQINFSFLDLNSQ
jgi:hypothetical protein